MKQNSEKLTSMQVQIEGSQKSEDQLRQYKLKEAEEKVQRAEALLK